MFDKNLKYLREKNNLEQLELAEMLGRKSASSISEWEKGKYTPKMKVLNELAKIFNVSIDDLMEKDLRNKQDETQFIKPVSVPVVSKISAGLPIEHENNIIDYAFMPANLVKAGKHYFYLRVDGDSMDKEFNHGDLLLVEKDSQVENGQIGIVGVNGYDATVKRIRRDEDKIILIPESNNPDHYPQIYTKDDEIHILGRVISVQKFY